MKERVRSSGEKVRLRQCLSEHPFGTIKRGFEQGYMLTRGTKKVKTEISLSVLAYNIKRVIKIMGLKELITKMEANKRAKEYASLIKERVFYYKEDLFWLMQRILLIDRDSFLKICWDEVLV
jgi:hypothetical protein